MICKTAIKACVCSTFLWSARQI